MSYFETRYTVEVRSAAVTTLDYDFATNQQYTKLLSAHTAPLRVLSGTIVSVQGYQPAFRPGDSVVAYVPHDFESKIETEKDRAGMTKYLYQVPEVYIVAKPINVSHELAASAIAGGVKCMTGLHYNLQVISSDSLLIVDGGTVGELAAQLALSLGLRTFAVGLKADLRCRTLQIEEIPHVLLTETGGLGVNHILDFSETHSAQLKQILLQCLGIRGKWAVTDYNLQLDPPEALQLFLRGGALSFVNEEVWLHSGLEHGKFVQILALILAKLERGEIEPRVTDIMSITNVAEARNRARQGVVIIKPL